jgi:hypothetical protein
MISCSVRRCEEADFEAIWTIINDGAHAYDGHVPADCLHKPYMSRQELQREISNGVQFWACQANGTLLAASPLNPGQNLSAILNAAK